MSKRASLVLKQEPKRSKRKGVRFPDELVFLDNIKENDIDALDKMLQRVSLQVDISGLNDEGLTPLHQAVLDGSEEATRLLIAHGANINKQDEDSWTPLHAACANGHANIVKILLDHGADVTIINDDGERPIDLVEPDDHDTICALTDAKDYDDNEGKDDEARQNVEEDTVTHL